MKISRDEISTLVRRVLMYYIRRKEREKEDGRVLFLIPEHPIGLDEVIGWYVWINIDYMVNLMLWTYFMKAEAGKRIQF